MNDASHDRGRTRHGIEEHAGLADPVHEALDRPGRGDHRLLRRPGRIRPGTLPASPADPGPGRDLRRPACSSRAEPTSRRARTSGSRWAGRRSARSGATGPTSRPTGRPITSIARRPGSSTTGPEAEHGKAYAELDEEARRGLKARLKHELRTNTYDPETGDLVVSPLRAEAMAAVGAHYAALFGHDPALDKLRDAYAIPADAVKTPERLEELNAFFFWASWACSTNRPGAEITYTNNWPSESLIDNQPSGEVVVCVGRQLRAPAGGHRRPGVVLRRVEGPRGGRARLARRGPAAGALAHAVDAGDAQVLLGRRGADRRPGRPRRGHGALRGRGLGLLRHPAGEMAALQRDPDLAHPDRHLLDRHAPGWPPGCSWPRPSRATSRSSSGWA